jgi:anaerobic selenocysteine-containing dehydrogenase
MTAPDVAKRLKAIRSRGGKVVVIDPCRTETADVATRHHFIKPGTDAAFLLALFNAVLELGPPRVERYGDRLAGLDAAIAAIRPFGVERAAAATGISAEQVREIASELRAASSSVVYGRMGLSTQPFGTVCQWLIQLLNLITGNLDAGGALPTQPRSDDGAGTRPGAGRPRAGRLSSAASSWCRWPRRSTPRARRRRSPSPAIRSRRPPGGAGTAPSSLEFMASIDIFERPRHADDPAAASMLRMTTATPQPTPRDSQRRAPQSAAEARVRSGTGKSSTARAATRPLEEFKRPPLAMSMRLRGPTEDPVSMPQGRTPWLDLERFSLALTPGNPGPRSRARRTFVADSEGGVYFAREAAQTRLVAAALRSNNSWMHNAHRLTKGPRRDQLGIHPEDAARRSIVDGEQVKLASRVGEISVAARVTDRVMPGVVCLPHGFGQGRAGVRLAVASALPGASYNDVSDEEAVDPVSGNAASALPVRVTRDSAHPQRGGERTSSAGGPGAGRAVFVAPVLYERGRIRDDVRRR